MPQTQPQSQESGGKISSPEVTYRLVSLAISQGLTVSESLRRMQAGTDGAEPVRISRTAADRILRDARRQLAETATVPEIAARMLALISAELAAVEAEQGSKDLDRLAKLASTLATVERLQPKAAPQSEVGLLSLREEGSTDRKTEGLLSLRPAEG